MQTLIRPVKRVIRRRFGWLPPYELRNKVLLGHTVPGIWRFENAEVRRLSEKLGPRKRCLVTTVIPTYKRHTELIVAIRSALAQTITDHTVIVVDDGAGLPAELPDDPRLIAVSLSRNSAVLGVVRNVGIRLANSDFVAFLDDDNSWTPDHLETALAALQADRRLDAVYTAMRRVYPDDREMDILSVPYDRQLAKERAFLDANSFVARNTPAVRFSRLRRDKGVLPREDWATLYPYSVRHRVEHIPKPTVRYLVNTDTYYTVWD